MLNLTMLLVAIGGGIFGAAIGALPAFIFTGIAGLIGMAITAVGGEATILNEVAFGVLFGPHIAFAGGVAAAAFAGNKKKYLGSGMETATPLIKTNDASVLLIGGIFGGLGYLLNYLFVSVKLPVDTVGLTVLTSAVIVRLVFGKTGLFGKYTASKAAGEAAAASENVKGRSYFPDAKTLSYTVVQALGLGLVVSYLVNITQIGIIGFVISATSLIFLQMGLNFPVTHHITLVAGYATLATGNIFAGMLFAVVAAILGEVVGRTVNSYCDTHIDPPATTIAICSLIIFTLL